MVDVVIVVSTLLTADTPGKERTHLPSDTILHLYVDVMFLPVESGLHRLEQVDKL